jgi:hypothetical protein
LFPFLSGAPRNHLEFLARLLPFVFAATLTLAQIASSATLIRIVPEQLPEWVAPTTATPSTFRLTETVARGDSKPGRNRRLGTA